MRPAAGEIRHDRALAIGASFDRDGGLRAHQRAGAVGADHQLGAQLATVLETQAGTPRAERQRLERSGAIQRQTGLVLEPAPERFLQQPVFHDPGEFAAARAIGIEFEQRLAVVTVNAHGVHRRCARLGHRAPSAQLRKERGISRTDRVHARVESGVGHARRRPLLRDERHARTTQAARQRGADQRATGNRHIVGISSAQAGSFSEQAVPQLFDLTPFLGEN